MYQLNPITAYLHSPVSANTGHVMPRSIEGNSGCGEMALVKSGAKGGDNENCEVWGMRISCVLAERYDGIS